MKKLTISVKDVTYKRLKKVCENAKALNLMQLNKPVNVTDKEIAKVISFCINDKAFNDTIKQLEELTNYERYSK